MVTLMKGIIIQTLDGMVSVRESLRLKSSQPRCASPTVTSHSRFRQFGANISPGIRVSLMYDAMKTGWNQGP